MVSTQTPPIAFLSSAVRCALAAFICVVLRGHSGTLGASRKPTEPGRHREIHQDASMNDKNSYSARGRRRYPRVLGAELLEARTMLAVATQTFTGPSL